MPTQTLVDVLNELRRRRTAQLQGTLYGPFAQLAPGASAQTGGGGGASIGSQIGQGLGRATLGGAAQGFSAGMLPQASAMTFTAPAAGAALGSGAPALGALEGGGLLSGLGGALGGAASGIGAYLAALI